MSSAALERARAGDDDAFRELTAPHLPELHLHCYRMLGSLSDADDVLQEVLLAAWQGLNAFAGRSSLRTWLYRIATNRCLNQIRAGKRRLRYEAVPPFDPPEPSARDGVTWLQPYPDSALQPGASRPLEPAARYEGRQAVELAFIVAVQRLPPRQVAALLLCDVLAFTITEVAAMLDTTNAAVKGALQRARASLDRQPDGAAGDARHRDVPGERSLAHRFAEAFTREDVDGVVALLTDDAWLAMPPAPHVYKGPAAIAAFLRASLGWRTGRRLHLTPTGANGQPAFGCYLADEEGPSASPIGMVVLTTSGDRITGLTRFLDPTLPERFGLAATLV